VGTVLELIGQRTTLCFFIGRVQAVLVPLTTVAGGVACWGVTVAADSSSSLFFPRFWERSVGVLSVGAAFAVVGVGGGRRLMRLEGTGLGVVERGGGARSICAGAAEVCCGMFPKA
jgi:hypothetical protein